MFRKAVFLLLALLLIGMASPQPVVFAGTAETQDNTLFIVVEDVTSQIQDCQIVSGVVKNGVQVVEKVEPCLPWTWTATAVKPWKEVKEKGLPQNQYVLATGSAVKDQKAAQDLLKKTTEKLNQKQNAKTISPLATCLVATRFKRTTGSGGGITITYETQYNVDSYCYANTIYDRELKSSSSTIVCWTDSYFGPGFDYARNVAVPAGSYTRWFSFNTLRVAIGSRVSAYNHYSGCSGTNLIVPSLTYTET